MAEPQKQQMGDGSDNIGQAAGRRQKPPKMPENKPQSRRRKKERKQQPMPLRQP